MKDSHRESAFTVSRREFLPALLQETLAVIGSFRGRQSFRLAEVGSLPDDQLAQVTPMVNPAHEIFVDQGYVCSRDRKTGTTLKLFPMEKENLAVFNLFNGRHSLGQISQYLSEELGWDEVESFAHTRDLFLSLVNHLVCVPKNPLEID